MPEYYPMPMFVKLPVKDIVKEANWYQDKLGFQKLYTFTDQSGSPIMVHIRRDRYQDLMLIQDEHSSVGSNVVINLLVKDIAAIAEKTEKQSIVSPPTPKPWQAVEMTLKDLDGHKLTLTEPKPNGESFQDVMTKVK
ncbi:glyoxalase [Lacticaseibacillus casei]|uniref:Glyoxalase n=1 Tax=Lacticaseibacillus zeae TaxID=57037 RepID=A0A5R8LXQ9_LACZE|nr:MULTISPECIES: VOC family protein [Lacticaseibacillus]MDE3283110.1 glyoxalase [Lacticaseibacillus casei]QVI31273.1 glyoxalase [Lacticaseibacillus zeae]TLF42043.1 glyoxalase [Lacticaseibacillus zeae]